MTTYRRPNPTGNRCSHSTSGFQTPLRRGNFGLADGPIAHPGDSNIAVRWPPRTVGAEAVVLVELAAPRFVRRQGRLIATSAGIVSAWSSSTRWVPRNRLSCNVGVPRC
jgi:hypothetical protein